MKNSALFLLVKSVLVVIGLILQLYNSLGTSFVLKVWNLFLNDDNNDHDGGGDNDVKIT